MDKVLSYQKPIFPTLASFAMTLIVLFALAACTPQVQETTPRQEIIAKAKVWKPERNPKAIILALHGMNDYSNGFADAGEFFARKNIALYAYDQRGFGRAAQTGIWAGEENLVADLQEAIKEIKQKNPKTPVYILGESMGASVAIIAVSNPDFPKVKGIILSAPAVWGDSAMNPFFRAGLWAVAHSFPDSKFTGSDLKIIASDNVAMLKALHADPLVIKKTRADTMYGLVQLMGHAYNDVALVKTPTLLLYGDNDQVIPPEAVHSAAENFSIHITPIYYPNGYHLLLRDLQREKVLNDITYWIEKQNNAKKYFEGKAD